MGIQRTVTNQSNLEETAPKVVYTLPKSMRGANKSLPEVPKNENSLHILRQDILKTIVVAIFIFVLIALATWKLR